MAQIQVFKDSCSMVQLSLRLRRVTKTKQFEIFQRLMLVVVLLIWFTTVMTSVFVRLSGDTEISGSYVTDASVSAGPSSFHSRKLVASMGLRDDI